MLFLRFSYDVFIEARFSLTPEEDPNKEYRERGRRKAVSWILKSKLGLLWSCPQPQAWAKEPV